MSRIFSGSENWGVLGGGQQVYVETVNVVFLPPRNPFFQPCSGQ